MIEIDESRALLDDSVVRPAAAAVAQACEHPGRTHGLGGPRRVARIRSRAIAESQIVIRAVDHLVADPLHVPGFAPYELTARPVLLAGSAIGTSLASRWLLIGELVATTTAAAMLARDLHQLELVSAVIVVFAVPGGAWLLLDLHDRIRRRAMFGGCSPWSAPSLASQPAPPRGTAGLVEATSYTFATADVDEFRAVLDVAGAVKGGPDSEGAFPGGGQFGVVEVSGTDTGVLVRISGRDWNGVTVVSYEREFAVDTRDPLS